MAVASRKTGKYTGVTCVTWKDIRCGEKLVVHSREWFDKNCIVDSDGDYVMNITERGGGKCTDFFSHSMFDFFGETVTVKEICDYILVCEEDGSPNYKKHEWYPEMFEKIA